MSRATPSGIPDHRCERMTTRDGRTICATGDHPMSPERVAPPPPETVAELTEPERFVRSYDPDEPEVVDVELPEDPPPPTPIEEMRARRDEGMETAERNAGEVWKFETDGFIYRYCIEHATMFTPDLWEAGLPDPPFPGTRKALGPRVQAAIRNGWIVHDGRTYRPVLSSNGDPGKVWRSLIYEGGDE